MAPVPKTPTRRAERGKLFSLASSTPAATRRRLDDPPLGALDEGDQVVDLGVARQLGADLLQGLGSRQPRADEDTVGLLQPADALRVDPLALEADRVQAVAGRLLADRLDEGESVHGGHRVAAQVGVAPHPAELVHGGEGADGGVIVDLDVAGVGRVVGEDDAVAHLAVMGDVGIGHEQAVAAHAGDAAPLGGAAVDGAELPKVIAVADLQPDFLALELQVLGIEADGRLGIDPVLPADPGRSPDLGRGPDLRAVADRDAGADHRQGSDLDTISQDGAGVDHGQRMDAGAHRCFSWSTGPRSTIAVESTASAASSPSTSALPATLQKVERSRSTSTS